MPTAFIKDQTRGYKEWGLWEIWVGPSGGPTQVYVPNPNDKVFDWAQGYFRVTDVDYTTGISVLEPWDSNPTNGGVDLEDVLLGSSLGETREQYRLYVKLGTLPFRASVDGGLKIYQANANKIKVFKGTDTSEAGQVISAVLNSSGVPISENVGLDLIANINGTNYAIRTPKEFVLTEAVQDGDVCTVVVYNNTNQPIGTYKHIVVATDFIRTADASRRYVVGIDLISPWLSATENDLLEYPVNLPIQSGSLQGRVRYSDGFSSDLPIDGIRFELQGIDNFVATQAGQTANLQLVYHLGPTEYANTGYSIPGDRWIPKAYRVRTIAEQGLYSAKLFAVPYWQSAAWHLDWYLYSLARDAVYNVTPYVQDAVGAPAFNGINYVSKQNLIKTINLQDIGMGLPYYQHVQHMDIRLFGAGSNAGLATYYEIEYTVGEKLGTGLFAVRTPGTTGGTFKLDISQGTLSTAEWLAKVYDPTEPLWLAGTEAAPPVPTHFRLKYGAFSRDVAVNDYEVVQDNIDAALAQGVAVRLEFFRTVSAVVQELGCSSLVVKV